MCTIWFMPEPEAPKPKKPSLFRQAIDILELMEVNDWNQVDVAKHLGISRARVTQILNILKIPKEKIDRMEKESVRITERRLRNL
ncbi:MAG: hypothetical protein IID16_09440 [Candidatus Marinimicrobia bacterium]|nr:hypothetical protein [Candidatus Neomarinimicrobiota bacterium]